MSVGNSEEWEYAQLISAGLFAQGCPVASLSFLCIVGEMSESRAKRVQIKEVDGWTLRMLIDYVYTAEIQVTEENVQVRVNTLTLCLCLLFKSKEYTT